MRISIAVALAIAGTFALQAPAGDKFNSTWWNGVAYNDGRFEPAAQRGGRPPLVGRTTWTTEKTAKGTVIRVDNGYLSADANGIVHVSPTLTPGSYWQMKEVKSESGSYNARNSWKGEWSRTTFTLQPAAGGLRGGKLGFRDGRLTVHPRNEGLAILSVTHIDADEISGK